MSVTDEQILERLRVLIGESDLETTSERMLRKKLEEEFKIDMLDKKSIIREEVERYLAEHRGSGEDEDGSDDSDDNNAPVRGSSLGCLLSEPLQKFLGEETLPRTQVVKRLWEYIKAHNLQDPKDKRKILLDDKMRTLFTSPLSMFTMNTQLSRHCKTKDADDQPRARPSKAAGDKRSGSAAKADKPKPKKAKQADGEGDGEKRKNNFNKPLRLSAELASWCGQDTMGRPELTKFFWAYVKEKNLQDPSNKQFILCDAKLKKVTGESRIQAFAIQKYLSGHILKD